MKSLEFNAQSSKFFSSKESFSFFFRIFAGKRRAKTGSKPSDGRLIKRFLAPKQKFKYTNTHERIHSFSTQVPPDDLRHRRRTNGYCHDAQECHTSRQAGPRLPLLRPARRGQDHLRTHLRQDNQLSQPARGRRSLRRMRIVHGVQRRALDEYPRARCSIKQLGRRHPKPHRASAHSATDREVQGVHNRRGAHAQLCGFQRLPKDSRRAARPRHIHPRHDREAQDPAYHSLAMPDLRLPAHEHRRDSEPPRLRCRQRRLHGRACSAQHHSAEGRRRHA